MSNDVIAKNKNYQEHLELFNKNLKIYLKNFTTLCDQLREELLQESRKNSSPSLSSITNINDMDIKKYQLPEKLIDINADIDMLNQLIQALTNYLEKIKCASTLCVKRNKMNETDMTLLLRHAQSLEQLYALKKDSSPKIISEALRESSNASGGSLVSAEESPKTKTHEASNRNQSFPANSPVIQSETQVVKKPLSELIADAAKLEYQISYLCVWLRRILFFVGSLLAAATAIAITTILMTPGVNIGAALVTIPSMLLASLAFFYLRKPVFMPESFNVGEIDFNVKVPMFSTLFTGVAGGYGIHFLKKLSIINKPREIAARNLAAGTVNCLTHELTKKVDAISNNDNVKKFLLAVIKKAEDMYNDGAKSTIYERRTSRMQKGRLILSETAKLIEANIIDEKTTVQTILDQKIAGSLYTYGQLLNAQRDTFSFWKRTTSTITGLATEFKDEFKDRKEAATRVHFKTLSMAVALAQNGPRA